MAKSMQDYFIHETAVVDSNVTIGSDSKIWHFCHIMSGAHLGEKCSLGQNVFIADEVHIGNNVKIQNNVSVYKGVEIQDDVFLGPSMVFTNIKNPRSHVNRKKEFVKTLVKKGVSIGANATIICGITLNEYAFISAGAVVTKDVKAFHLVAGVPAKTIGFMSSYGERLEFTNGVAKCPFSKETYILENDEIKKVS